MQRLFSLTNHSGSSFVDSSNDSLRFVASIEFRVGSNFSNHIERFYFRVQLLSFVTDTSIVFKTTQLWKKRSTKYMYVQYVSTSTYIFLLFSTTNKQIIDDVKIFFYNHTPSSVCTLNLSLVRYHQQRMRGL